MEIRVIYTEDADGLINACDLEYSARCHVLKPN
jgi:hypothetical protein